MSGYGMENVLFTFMNRQARRRCTLSVEKRKHVPRIESFAVLPRAELAAEVKVWWAWAFTDARRALDRHAKADNAQS
jgi:hypothetical protein